MEGVLVPAESAAVLWVVEGCRTRPPHAQASWTTVRVLHLLLVFQMFILRDGISCSLLTLKMETRTISEISAENRKSQESVKVLHLDATRSTLTGFPDLDALHQICEEPLPPTTYLQRQGSRWSEDQTMSDHCKQRSETGWYNRARLHRAADIEASFLSCDRIYGKPLSRVAGWSNCRFLL